MFLIIRDNDTRVYDSNKIPIHIPMVLYVHKCNAEPCITKKFGGQNMNKHYAMLDLFNGELLTTIDGEVIVYESRELCDKYIVSIEDADYFEDQYSVIDVTKLINKYI